MPYRLSERLGPYGRREDEEPIEEEPRFWLAAGIVSAFVVTVMAVATFVTTRDNVKSPGTMALLLALAIAPNIIQLRVKIPELVWHVVTIAPIAAIHLFGESLGVYDQRGGWDQASMMILVWIVGGAAAVAARGEIVFVTACAFAVAIGRQYVDDRYNSALIWSVGILIALMAGLFIRTLTVALLNTKLAETAVKEQAATDERQRIAREVHDVIAHSMTVTMLHLTAARLAVGRGDPDAATEALEEAERAGRTSLNEIRHTVGLLRTDDSATAAPLPSAVDVTSLVEGYRAAGLDVACELDGDLATVEPATGLALYRVLQESLTNAGRHSPGAHTRVAISVGPPLVVEILTNGGKVTRGAGDGLGIPGMAERVNALEGAFEAGPTTNGWRVSATIP